MPITRHRPNAGECHRARVLAGLSLRAAANELDCSHAHLSKIERGLVGASAVLLKRMAALYGVEMSTLTSFTEDAA